MAENISAPTATVKLNVKGLRSNQGQIAIAVFNEENPKAFPRQGERAFRHLYLPIESQNGELTLSIPDLPLGSYAIALFHDEDGDRKVKTGLFGMPKEGVAFSNNPKLLFGPPSFEQAKVSVSNHETQLTIEMKYFPF